MKLSKEKLYKTIYLVFIIIYTILIIGFYADIIEIFWLKPSPGANVEYGTRDAFDHVYNFPHTDASYTGVLTLLTLINLYLLLDFFLFSKIKGWKKTVVVILSVISILGITELVFWYEIEQKPSMFTPHPVWLWRVTPNLNNYKFIMDTTVNSNKYGFRNHDFPIRKPENQFRVMILGDSSAHGFMVNEEETFAYLLEKSLREKNPGKDILVINTANPGSTTTMGRVFFEEFGSQFKPDLLIISYNNDHMPERETDLSRIPKGFTRQIKKLLYKSMVFQELRKEIINYRVRKDPSLAVIKPGEKTINRVPIDEYKGNIKYFKEYADKNNARVILLQMPKTVFIKDYYNALEQAAKENNCLYIDLMKQWQQLPLKEYIFQDGIHPTAKGHKRIAESLVELFDREKLIK